MSGDEKRFSSSMSIVPKEIKKPGQSVTVLGNARKPCGPDHYNFQIQIRGEK